jgi:hypothetical protein
VAEGRHIGCVEQPVVAELALEIHIDLFVIGRFDVRVHLPGGRGPRIRSEIGDVNGI